MSRIKDLEKEIKHHNDLYWIQNAPEISDTDYDLLIEELRDLDPDNPLLDEFTEQISGTPVPHRVPMLSLGKAYTIKEVMKWVNKIKCDHFTISPKMDGASCELVYGDNGKLLRASTRGNGMVGEDVTQAVSLIDNIPQQLSNNPDGEIEIRGEIVMHLSEFKKYEDSYANPRNLASGTIKQKNPNKRDKKNLNFYAYNLLGTEHETESDKFSAIREFGLTHVRTKTVTKDKVEETLEEFSQGRGKLDYEIDGIIIMAGDVSLQKKMGCTSHHPRYAIALKFQGESGSTILEDIEWSVSRTAQMTPVALIKPIKLSGAMISRISVHHAGFVESMKLTKGCVVEVTRRGEVIPHIERKVKDNGGKYFMPPTSCPSCGATTVRKDDFLYCSSPETCDASGVGRIKHFLSVLEADGFGDKIIKVLYDSGLVTSPEQLFALTEDSIIEGFNDYKGDKQNRMGEKTAKKLVAEIQAKRTLPLDVFLRSLGIKELGKHVSKILADKCDTLNEVFQLTEDDLLSIDSIGESIATSVVNGLEEQAKLIYELIRYITIEKPVQKASGAFSGQSFVFTGTLTQMGRKEAQNRVQALGGETPSSVKKDLTYLVCGGGGVSSKQQKADKYNQDGAGIKIISENDFVKMIGD